MTHIPVAVYTAAALGGLSVTVVSLLLHRQNGSRRLLYFGLFMASVVMLLLCEMIRAYGTANSLPVSMRLEAALCVVYAAGELLHVFAVIRLAYAVVRLHPRPPANALHMSALALYGLATAWALLSDSSIVITHAALAGAQLWAVLVILRHRDRVRDPRLRRFVFHLVVLSVVFAPSIGISIYTGYAQRLPFGDMTLQVLYLIGAEVIIGVHAVNAYFVPAAPRLQRDDAGLSQREWDIVELVTKGYTNREVGELLSISRKTVTNHLYHIYKKVGVKNRVELLAELNALLQEPLE